MEGTMAVVTTWAADFAPKNWSYCDGQLISIAQNQALFSLLGTIYGGDGRVTFGLPDLRSRTVPGTGHGPGLSNYVLGEKGGSPSAQLTIANIPPHAHSGMVNMSLQGNNTDGSVEEPNGNYPGALASGYGTTADTTMPAPTYNGVVGVAGSGIPYNTQAPYLVVNYIICMYGIFPSRN